MRLFDFGPCNARTIPRRKGVVESGFDFAVGVFIENVKTHNGIVVAGVCRVSDGTRGKRYSNFITIIDERA